MNTREIEELLKVLGVRQYRWEIIQQYIESPLRLGIGFREFMLMNMLIPVLPVGPTGKPVPGGALVTSVGVPKYPGTTFNARDGMNIINRRSSSGLFDFDVLGNEVFPQGLTSGNWISFSIDGALVAGALSMTLLGATPGLINEVIISSVDINPIDNAGVIHLTLTPDVSAGSIEGMASTQYITYKNDETNNLYSQNTFRNWPLGWKFRGDTVNTILQLLFADGAGAEEVVVTGYYRQY